MPARSSPTFSEGTTGCVGFIDSPLMVAPGG
jgi:hypothetical protein